MLAHYERQTDEEATAEDDALLQGVHETVMELPLEFVPAVRELIAGHSR